MYIFSSGLGTRPHRRISLSRLPSYSGYKASQHCGGDPSLEGKTDCDDVPVATVVERAQQLHCVPVFALHLQ